MIGNFASLGLKGGVWEGALHVDKVPARIALTLSGQIIGLAEVEPEAEGLWRIRARLPAETLAEGMQTYMLIADDGEGLEPPRPGARPRPGWRRAPGQTTPWRRLRRRWG